MGRDSDDKFPLNPACGGGKKYHRNGKELSLDGDGIRSGIFRSRAVYLLSERHVRRGNDGADGGGAVLCDISDWQKQKIIRKILRLSRKGEPFLYGKRIKNANAVIKYLIYAKT